MDIHKYNHTPIKVEIAQNIIFKMAAVMAANMLIMLRYAYIRKKTHKRSTEYGLFLVKEY